MSSIIGTDSADTLYFGPFRLARAERLLLKDDKPVAIGSRALDILIALTARAGKIVSQRELIDVVWQGVSVEDGVLRVHIASLRKALEEGKDGSRYVINVQGRGYSFVAPTRRTAVRDPTDRSVIAYGAALPRAVPALPHLLVGRDETIAEVSSLLLSRRFVSVVGSGGIGKRRSP